MKIAIYVCGRLREDYLRAAEAEYRKRLRSYCKLDVVEFKSDRALLAAVPDRARLYALDECGELLTSAQFAHMLAGDEIAAVPVVFAIGGPDGHSDALRARARRVLAFGRLTVAHRLVRVLLVEQIYRGFRIIRGEPYHRD
ncbi:MAG: 23S rRNA (pseudouridine(1915)-N(3))-methyltransferase RlmH [Proteobacteria bacterium]|nr:23S rRNA (pseudouridine(1915)-N(3))-methyltransferase RlmH [Pseudomonadota bacterium]